MQAQCPQCVDADPDRRREGPGPAVQGPLPQVPGDDLAARPRPEAPEPAAPRPRPPRPRRPGAARRRPIPTAELGCGRPAGAPRRRRPTTRSSPSPVPLAAPLQQALARLGFNVDAVGGRRGGGAAARAGRLRGRGHRPLAASEPGSPRPSPSACCACPSTRGAGCSWSWWATSSAPATAPRPGRPRPTSSCNPADAARCEHLDPRAHGRAEAPLPALRRRRAGRIEARLSPPGPRGPGPARRDQLPRTPRRGGSWPTT